MKNILKVLILLGILTTGILIQKFGIVDIDELVSRLEHLAESWWLPPASIFIQLLLYMLAFPGSLIMWTLGVIYQPLAATVLVVAGGVTGAVAAYFFASSMSSAWTLKFSRSKVFMKLQKNSGFLQLCALRCLPGFPHSFINYSSGILKVSLVPFVISTTLGFTVKGFIYCSAIYSAFHFDDVDAAITLSTLWPLLVLVIFSVLGMIIQKKYFSE